MNWGKKISVKIERLPMILLGTLLVCSFSFSARAADNILDLVVDDNVEAGDSMYVQVDCNVSSNRILKVVLRDNLTNVIHSDIVDMSVAPGTQTYFLTLPIDGTTTPGDHYSVHAYIMGGSFILSHVSQNVVVTGDEIIEFFAADSLHAGEEGKIAVTTRLPAQRQIRVVIRDTITHAIYSDIVIDAIGPWDDYSSYWQVSIQPDDDTPPGDHYATYAYLMQGSFILDQVSIPLTILED